MGAKPGNRKEREREARKQEVLDVALDLFAEKGFHAVSMQEIAETTEFSVGTLYNLFENKDGLFEELIISNREYMCEKIFTVLDSPGDSVQRIRRFIHSAVELLEQFATFMKVHVTELGKKGSKVAHLAEENDIKKLLNARLTEIIATGIEEGQFRQIDALIAAETLNAAIETLAFEMAGHFDKDAAVDKFTKLEQFFVDGLLVR